ncbi:MAG: B12-binding domain-containing radical SAM protein [Lachnospiraceae bacterium]|nr:B12-binding domain-containing radical SAM protein [Lachnospiraceae bacterium]
MKFLLVAINAKYIHSNPALYSLKSYAVKLRPEYSGDIEIAEYTINHHFDDILSGIYGAKPDVIGISCYIWNINMVEQLIPELQKLLPSVPIWLGGPEVSYEANKLFTKFPYLGGVMVGEGEQTFLELMDYYEGKHLTSYLTLQEIPGLCLSTGYTKIRELTDLSEIPFLYDDLERFKNRIIYYESSRGCPFRCSYCLSSIDKSVRFRDMDVVKRELQFFIDHKVSQVKFVDRTFNCNHKHAMEIWQYIYEHDNGVTNFHFEIAADILNEEEIELLSRMRPGLVQLEIGVQSTNEQCLKEIDRHVSTEHLRQVVEAIRRGENIHIHLDLIAGLPYEGFVSFRNSFNDVYAMKPEQLQLGFLKVLKGSKMHEKAKEYGLFYQDRAPYEVLYTKWLSYDEILRLKKIEEMVELYYNSNQYTHALPIIMEEFDSPFDFFSELADYFEKEGLFVTSPSRVYRYQALLHFAMSKNPMKEEMYKEALLFDMYLRENLKSRPEFAGSKDLYYDVKMDWYKNEEQVKEMLPNYTGYQAKQVSKMTHMEYFSYPVWDEKALQAATGKGDYFILFDYQRRNPLNEDAYYVEVRVNP